MAPCLGDPILVGRCKQQRLEVRSKMGQRSTGDVHWQLRELLRLGNLTVRRQRSAPATAARGVAGSAPRAPGAPPVAGTGLSAHGAAVMQLQPQQRCLQLKQSRDKRNVRDSGLPLALETNCRTQVEGSVFNQPKGGKPSAFGENFEQQSESHGL